jgi:ribonuclease HI
VKVTIYIDGGARGNPGPAAAGIVISDGDGTALRESGVYIGEATNNVAEYTGLVRALEAALAMEATEVEAYSDSELVVKQMAGEYRVKNKGLIPLYEEATYFSKQFDAFSLTHVRREKNVKADALVNMAIDCRRDVGDELIPTDDEDAP